MDGLILLFKYFLIRLDILPVQHTESLFKTKVVMYIVYYNDRISVTIQNNKCINVLQL